MNEAWLRQRERGSPTLLWTIAWIARRIGRPAARVLLYPICGYFVLFSGKARKASRAYLTRALGRPAGWRDVFHHYHVFASVLLDRVLFISGRAADLRIEHQGITEIDRLLEQGRGLLLLGAHFGNFDALSDLALRHDKPINVLMHEANAQKFAKLMRALAPDGRAKVIMLGSPSTFLRVKEALDRGEMVGMLGDRGLPGEKTVQLPFLGAPAAWPQGPMLLASLLQAPVLLFFPVYCGGNRYSLQLERFSECIHIDRKHRKEQLRLWIERYAERLEHHCRAAPYNWFNFYDFWAGAQP